MKRRAGLAAFVLVSLASLAACHRPRKYEATVQLERMRVVRRDETGRPLTIDVELSYFECPGDQVEVVRGGAEFAECLGEYHVGDKVKAQIEQRWHPDGHYKWHVLDVGGCARPLDANDEASYTMIRECEDWKENGATVGFHCNVAPQKTLLKKCPWFSKH